MKIEAEDACGRFTARVLRDITIGDSRDWFPGAEVATYFSLLEQKQISNAVDATNFAWLAMGQPTHAFDLDKIEGGIIVRRARKGEKLKTLDGVERTLDPEDLVVADHVKPLGLAGVMGGWDTMITPDTKNVLVEAAWFEPMAVRRTARRHGLHTDASHRFERGADFNAGPVASAIVSRILLANGGSIEGDLVDVRVPAWEARTANRQPITLALSEVHRILGKTEDKEGITAPLSKRTLTALGCKLAANSPQAPAWQVTLAQLAPRSRTRNRPHRRSRPRLRLQPLRQHPPHIRRRRQSAAMGGSRIRSSPAPCLPPDSTKPSPAPSAPLRKPHSPRPSRARSFRSAIRSAKKPAYCAPRLFPACS